MSEKETVTTCDHVWKDFGDHGHEEWMCEKCFAHKPESHTTPTQERDLAYIAMAKNIVEQVVSLDRALSEARKLGLMVDIRFQQNNPTVSSVHVLKKNKAKDIYNEVMS